MIYSLPLWQTVYQYEDLGYHTDKILVRHKPLQVFIYTHQSAF